MKGKLIYFLVVIFLAFPVMVIVTPILILGLFCEFTADATDDYLHWVNKLNY